MGEISESQKKIYPLSKQKDDSADSDCVALFLRKDEADSWEIKDKGDEAIQKNKNGRDKTHRSQRIHHKSTEKISVHKMNHGPRRTAGRTRKAGKPSEHAEWGKRERRKHPDGTERQQGNYPVDDAELDPA